MAWVVFSDFRRIVLLSMYFLSLTRARIPTHRHLYCVQVHTYEEFAIGEMRQMPNLEACSLFFLATSLLLFVQT